MSHLLPVLEPTVAIHDPRAGLSTTPGFERHTAAHAETGKPRSPAWLDRVVESIQADFDQSLSVQSLAAEVGLHPIHVSRVFRRVHRISIRTYLRQVRIRFACRRLRQPGVHLADLALRAGFADQSQFTRAFKSVMGTTPGRYRKWLREVLHSASAAPGGHQRVSNRSLSLESSSAKARNRPSPETAKPKSFAGRSSCHTVRSAPRGRSR